jgi:hypothetical protein
MDILTPNNAYAHEKIIFQRQIPTELMADILQCCERNVIEKCQLVCVNWDKLISSRISNN